MQESEATESAQKKLIAKINHLDSEVFEALQEWIDEQEDDDDEENEKFTIGLKPVETFDKEYLYDYCVKLIKHVENAFITFNELLLASVKLSILKENKLINIKDIVLERYEVKGKILGFYAMYRSEYDEKVKSKKK
jgi:hypothetical protein